LEREKYRNREWGGGILRKEGVRKKGKRVWNRLGGEGVKVILCKGRGETDKKERGSIREQSDWG